MPLGAINFWVGFPMNFEKDQVFHVISRAVDDKKIFDREEERYRFIFQVYAANFGKSGFNLQRKDIVETAKLLLAGKEPSSKIIVKEHEPLVHILDFCLVMNHYHFCLVPDQEKGMPIFMGRLNVGFAKYFNLKYGRKGALFGSRYRRIPVETDLQMERLSRYINVINPLDVFQPGWRERGLKNEDAAFEFLRNYEFSSFPEKLGERNSKILAPRQIREKYGLESSVKREFLEYIEFVKDFLGQNVFSGDKLFSE